MKPNLFVRDIVACLRVPWPLRQRAKSLGLMLIDRWNEYSPLKWQSLCSVSIPCHGRELSIEIRLENQDFAAFRELFIEGVYEAPLGQPKTILDLGGNCGYAALLFASRYPEARIATVEPHPGNLEALRRNLNLNGIDAKVIPAAATVTDGPVTLLVRRSLFHGLVPIENRGFEGQLAVRGISVPSLMKELGWEEIDVVKIDIEGYEKILLGGQPPWLRQVRRIIGECHFSYQLPQVRADLEPMGFRVCQGAQPELFLAVRNGEL